MNFNSPESFLEKLNNWFNGFIALPLLAVGYGYLEIFSGGLVGLYPIDIYVTLAIIALLLISAVYITYTYKLLIRGIGSDDPLALRIATYFDVSKLFFLRIFIIAMLAVIGLYITGSIAYAGFYAFLLFLLSIYRPSLLTVANKLGLKGEERSEFLKNRFTIIN